MRTNRLVVAGLAVAVIAAAAYLSFILTHPQSNWLAPVDLRVYVRGGRAALHGTPLYNWPGAQLQFTYPPFAALVFVVLAVLPWHVVLGVWSAAGVAALAVTVWLALAGLGYRRGAARLGGTLLTTAVVFWTAPVLHTVYLGQIELLLMALVLWDLCQPEGRKWQGIGVGIAAGIKLVPLIFIPYFLLTRRYRQAAVAAATFVLTILIGFAVLPGPSRTWWLDGLFAQGSRTGFIGRNTNQSLDALITRLSGSVAAGKPVWIAVAVVTAIVGLACAAVLDRSGHRLAGIVVCALTGLLVSPVSWDHHWVWIVPVIVLLAGYGLRAGGALRWTWLGGALLVTALFGGWPGLLWGQPPSGGDFFEGLIWWPPGTQNAEFLKLGDQPGFAEYHWHGFQLIVGNLYVLSGLALLVVAVGVTATALVRRRQRRDAAVPALAVSP